MPTNTPIGPFDSAFCAVVETLNKFRKSHNKFANKAELLGKLQVPGGNYHKITTGLRSIPREKMAYIKNYLFYEFDVCREFMETNRGPMFNSEEHAWLEPGATYIGAADRIAALEAENMALKEANKVLQAKIPLK